MTLTRSLAEIYGEMQMDLMRRNPRLSNWGPLSVIRTITEAFAVQFYHLDRLREETENNLFVNTATGMYLDRFVADRLPFGRQPGNKATGQIEFRSNYPAVSTITIPAGTVVSVTTESGEPVLFETLADGVINYGETSVLVDAQAQLPGEVGNIPAQSLMKIITPILFVVNATNPLPFLNGTDAESDDDLRRRYIYAIEMPGRATKSMIEQHLFDLDSVFEAKCFTVNPGEVEIIVDCASTVSHDPNIDVTIVDNLAAGVVARGLLAATAGPLGNETNLGDCAGGFIWVRPEETIPEGASFNISYQTYNGVDKTAFVQIPGGTPKGYAIRATMDSERTGNLEDTDRAAIVTGLPGVGKSFTILIGQGEYPYLFNLPERIPVTVSITLRKTPTAEEDLENKIKTSVEGYLAGFGIGDKLEFSDLAQCIFTDYDTGQKFSGVDMIVNILASGNDQSISGFNQNIIMDNDQRLIPGVITVESTV